jgi:prevent-host-death family protein
MYPIPPVYPISELRDQAREALRVAARQPVIITLNGRASAVLLGYQLYNELIEKLRALEYYQQAERADWSALSEDALTRVWDNSADAAYDQWRELYGVQAR